MVAYEVAQTLSDFGGVNRGLCQLHTDNTLKYIEECEDIAYRDGQITGIRSNSKQVISLATDTLISMNFWYFTPDIFKTLVQVINTMLAGKSSPLVNECYLPQAVMKQIQQHNKQVTVLSSSEPWFGLTYPEDNLLVSKKIAAIFDKN